MSFSNSNNNSQGSSSNLIASLAAVFGAAAEAFNGPDLNSSSSSKSTHPQPQLLGDSSGNRYPHGASHQRSSSQTLFASSDPSAVGMPLSGAVRPGQGVKSGSKSSHSVPSQFCEGAASFNSSNTADIAARALGLLQGPSSQGGQQQLRSLPSAVSGQNTFLGADLMQLVQGLNQQPLLPSQPAGNFLSSLLNGVVAPPVNSVASLPPNQAHQILDLLKSLEQWKQPQLPQSFGSQNHDHSTVTPGSNGYATLSSTLSGCQTTSSSGNSSYTGENDAKYQLVGGNHPLTAATATLNINLPVAAHGIAKTGSRNQKLADRGDSPSLSAQSFEVQSSKSEPSDEMGSNTILPCRARGMPVDHNFQTAHFVIPETIRHGEDLICSFETCRVSGAKFRYCANCRVPVAKRNFHRRHSHGLPVYSSAANKMKQQKTVEIAASASPVPSADVTSSAKKPSKAATADKPSAPGNGKKSQAKPAAPTASSNAGRGHKRKSSDSSNKLHHATTNTNSRKKGRHPPVATDTDAERADIGKNNNGKVGPPPFDLEGDIPVARQWQWASLLGKRPAVSNSDMMSAWLLEVMTVSDLKAPYERLTAGTSSLSQSSNDFPTGPEAHKKHASSPSRKHHPRANDEESVMCLDGGELSSDTSSITTPLSSSEETTSSDSSFMEYHRNNRKNKKEARTKPSSKQHVAEHPQGPQAPATKKRRADEHNKTSSCKQQNGKDADSSSKRESSSDPSDDVQETQQLSGSYAEWKDRKKKKIEAATLVQVQASVLQKQEIAAQTKESQVTTRDEGILI